MRGYVTVIEDGSKVVVADAYFHIGDLGRDVEVVWRNRD